MSDILDIQYNEDGLGVLVIIGLLCYLLFITTIEIYNPYK